MKNTLISAATAVFSFMPLHAAIIGTSLGTSAPPSILGGYPMTLFGNESPNSGNLVSAVDSPLGGEIVFSPDLTGRRVPDSWGSWSHNYTGNVYIYEDTAQYDSVTIALPAGTTAFYLFAEPNEFKLHNFTVTANDGTIVSADVEGNAGASGFGFHVTENSSLTSILVTSSDSMFAIGEFGISVSEVPEPANYSVLVSLILLGVLGIRRRGHNIQAS